MPYPLLADRGGTVARAYGVRRGLGPVAVASRRTFLIGPDGLVVRRGDKVDVHAHPTQVEVALAEEGFLGEDAIPRRGKS